MGQAPQRAAGAEDHQVDVGVRGHVAAPVTAVGHQGDPPGKGVGPGTIRRMVGNVGRGRLQLRQGRSVQVQDHFVPQVGDRPAELDAGATLPMTLSEPLMPFGQALAHC